MKNKFLAILANKEGEALVAKVCAEQNLHVGEFEELIQVEIDQTGKQKKRGITEQFDDILDRIEIEED